jgi:hypothetical protein
VAPEGERLAKVGFGDEFGLPSGAGVVFLASRELLTLPIGSFYVGSSVGSPAVYLGSDGRGHKIGVTGGALIFTLVPKSAVADIWETFWGRR